ncbi:hypothetical protein GCM10010405_35370 [Streptomyces macrosporus]|uniref:Uncharacterized protein n=1 Tax=Streptomyces macrosporus TaxID=44032 RepID=A0ABP5X8W8_9ACTN
MEVDDPAVGRVPDAPDVARALQPVQARGDRAGGELEPLAQQAGGDGPLLLAVQDLHQGLHVGGVEPLGPGEVVCHPTELAVHAAQQHGERLEAGGVVRFAHSPTI